MAHELRKPGTSGVVNDMIRRLSEIELRPLPSHASLVLFSRAVMTTLAVLSAGLGFLTGVRLKADTYDPHTFAIGAAALFCAASTVIAFLLYRRRLAKDRYRALQARCEQIADENWELREAQERARRERGTRFGRARRAM